MSKPFEALAEVPNACQPVPGLVTGGQPSAADLERFRAAGGGIVTDSHNPYHRVWHMLREPEHSRSKVEVVSK